MVLKILLNYRLIDEQLLEDGSLDGGLGTVGRPSLWSRPLSASALVGGGFLGSKNL